MKVRLSELETDFLLVSLHLKSGANSLEYW